MQPSSDAELVQRLLERDESALREIIREHSAAVYGIARRVIVDPTRAEEVAQDAFVALWNRPGVFDPDRGSLRTFLLGVARNKAVDLVRREQSLRAATERVIEMSQAGPSIDAVAASEQRVEMVDALRELPRSQREAIVLAYFGGRTYREVATELGIPEGTAKTRLRDGLNKLRERLAARGGNE